MQTEARQFVQQMCINCHRVQVKCSPSNGKSWKHWHFCVNQSFWRHFWQRRCRKIHPGPIVYGYYPHVQEKYTNDSLDFWSDEAILWFERLAHFRRKLTPTAIFRRSTALVKGEHTRYVQSRTHCDKCCVEMEVQHRLLLQTLRKKLHFLTKTQIVVGVCTLAIDQNELSDKLGTAKPNGCLCLLSTSLQEGSLKLQCSVSWFKFSAESLTLC